VHAQDHDRRYGGYNQQNGQGNEEAAANAHRISAGTRLIRWEQKVSLIMIAPVGLALSWPWSLVIGR
jgi:hypothetical protein